MSKRGERASPSETPLGARADLPARFYATVSVADVASRSDGVAFQVLLDGKPVRTPRKAPLAAPTRALAEAIAEEWRQQQDRVDPATMPLTRMANTAMDGVAGREVEVRADIIGYAGSDLVCYFAEGPRELVERQSQGWGAIHAWTETSLGARFCQGKGVMPVAQRPEALAAIERALAGQGPFALTALHVMTSLTGSALLALAHARGEISAERAWQLAHIDEDWQISQWGEDAEAAARRAARWAEMLAASRFFELARER